MGELLLELRCTACRKKRSYRVHDVIADQNGEVHIQDEIRCKNCGMLDQYELEPGAYLALMAHSIKMIYRSCRYDLDEMDNDDHLRFAKLITHDGRDLTAEETEAEYIEKIRQHPRRADLRVGYGNLLLFLRRRDQARGAIHNSTGDRTTCR